MKYLRGPKAENKENAELNHSDKDRGDLRAAWAQITILRESNKQLLCRLQQTEKKLQNQQLLEDQLVFLREREATHHQHLSNLDQINLKLRQQLEATEKEKQLLALRLASFGEVYPSVDPRRTEQPISSRCRMSMKEKMGGFSQQTSARTSICVASSNERAKQNHSSTPKSKLRINIDNFIPESIHQKRKVFF